MTGSTLCFYFHTDETLIERTANMVIHIEQIIRKQRRDIPWQSFPIDAMWKNGFINLKSKTAGTGVTVGEKRFAMKNIKELCRVYKVH